jgi:antitoxin CptB
LRTDRDADQLATWRHRLRWRCRRGMRELDIVLAAFVEQTNPAAGPRELAAFERLLDYADDVLLEWLMGRSLASDRELADVVARIRRVAAGKA